MQTKKKEALISNFLLSIKSPTGSVRGWLGSLPSTEQQLIPDAAALALTLAPNASRARACFPRAPDLSTHSCNRPDTVSE